MSYQEEVYEKLVKKDPEQKEFHQATYEVLTSLKPIIDKNEKLYREQALLERMTEPERIILFRVPWVDRNGQVQVNRGYRIQFNSAIGPYKGGLRFRDNVNLSILKFLAFEQIFKNSLTGLPIGGGKGGSDFDPKGKTDNEVMNFCQSFMTELFRHIGKDTDVPAGDIGVGAREIGFLYGQYKRLTGLYEGVLTGKGLTYGGSLARTEATGYGLLYITDEILKSQSSDMKGKNVVISGSGNVAIFACEKAQQLGAKVLTMSDSNGFIYDKNGINLDVVKEIKLGNRGRIKDYTSKVKDSEYFEGKRPWGVKCDIALPCATQNEIDENDAKELVKNGCKIVAEGANMPSNIEAIKVYQANNVLYMPGKAANAGGVATSALEMSQNSMRLSWTFDETDNKLKNIMKNIFNNVNEASKEYKVDYMQAANIVGFEKVATAMLAQGVV